MEPPHRPDSSLLEADASRQASDALRGYRYQIWLSVEAWLGLGDLELLELEIAEDFDRLGQGEATAHQVKDVAHNLTLRSSEVVEAIGNFWEHRRRNPQHDLKFRFITTASIGVERGSPFGSGAPGLETWASAARTGEGVGPLRDFLLTVSVSEELKQFLRSASEEEIRVQLLQPVEWAWKQADAEFVKERVRQRLVTLGQDKALPWDAANVADALFDRAMQAASAKEKTDRILDKAQFLTLFAEKTTRRISLPETMAGLREFGLLETLRGIEFPISAAPSNLVSGPPAPPAQLAPRQELVDSLRRRLASQRRLVLAGTTGMGKSTLAKLIAEGGWIWAGLHWEKPLNRRVLQEVGARVGPSPHSAGVVLDDYSPETVDEVPLGALLSLLQDRGVPFIVTTSKTLPSRIVTALELPQDCLVAVPGFDRDETKDLLVASGCPSSRADDLAPVLRLVAAGHPQLIHARIRDLASAGWPDLPVQQVGTHSPTVDQVLGEVRTSLPHLLPEGPRTLAYRLGLLRLPFRREHALALGDVAPAIALPGEAFEQLNGPWIERLGDRYYGVSPLLAGAVVEVWTVDQSTALHRSIARLLVTTKPLTVREAPGALLHAYEGRDSDLLAGLAFSVIRADVAVQNAIFPGLQWLFRFGADGTLPGFIAPADKLALRELQYRVAPKAEQKLAWAARWDEESRSPALAGEGDPFYRLRFTTTMLMDWSTPHPIARRLQWLREADGPFAEFTRLHPELDQRLPLEPGGSERVDAVVSLFSFVLHACDDIDKLHELALGLKLLDEGFRGRLLEIFDLVPALATSAVDRCLVGQNRKPEPNWSRCLAALGELAEMASHWHREDLRAAAVRAQARVMHEFLHDSEAALQLLRQERAGASSAVLEDEEAELLQDQNQHAAALSIWRAGLSRWAAQAHADPILLGYAAKKAAISAWQLGEWAEAARLFLDASTRLRRFHEASFAEPGSAPQLLLVPIALLADHAYCLWRGGDERAAISAFASCLLELEGLGEHLADLDDFRIFRKLMGHVLLWLYEPLHLTEPYPGFLSSPRVRREILGLPTTDLDNLWALLCQLDATAHDEPRVLERIRGRLAASADRKVVVMLHNAEVAHALREARIERMVPALARFCGASSFTPHVSSCLRVGMLFGLLSWTCGSRGVAPPWEEWRAAMEEAVPEDTGPIDSWIEDAREVFSQNAMTLRAALRQRSADEKTPFQLLRVAIDPVFSPEDVFGAQVLLLISPYSGMGRPYGDVVAKAFEERWRQLLTNPAALVAPRLNVPAIREACDSSRTSFSKAAAIVLAAEPAVRVPLGDANRTRLKVLRDGAEEETHTPPPSAPPLPGAAPEEPSPASGIP